MQSGQRSKSCLSNNPKTTEANLTKLHRKIEHSHKVFHAQELGSYAQGQGSLAVFKVTARDQGHYKGPSGAFVTYCNISCFLSKMFHSPLGYLAGIIECPIVSKYLKTNSC